jgi:DNA-binding XRE family transcriptional regulator
LLVQDQKCSHDHFVGKSVGADKTRRADTPLQMFGLAITKLRVKKDESQATVAPRIGCDQYHLRNIEQGKENLSFELMYAIIEYFEMLPLSRFWQFAEELARENTSTH